MKAVRAGEGRVAVVDVDEPPGRGELLDMQATSVCASDLSYVGWGFDKILGHELAGLREDGTGAVVEALYGCMECEQCRRGAYNLCPTHPQRALGVSVDGGMAEQFRAPAERLVPLPAGLDVRDACLVEPASVAWHALRLAGTGPGKRVGIVGGGALGLLAVAGARRMGAEDVAVEARHPHQREAGERLGARVGAATRTGARWSTPPPCSPTTPRSPARSSPTGSRSRTPSRRSASRPTARRAPSGW